MTSEGSADPLATGLRAACASVPNVVTFLWRAAGASVPNVVTFLWRAAGASATDGTKRNVRLTNGTVASYNIPTFKKQPCLATICQAVVFIYNAFFSWITPLLTRRMKMKCRRDYKFNLIKPEVL